MPERVCVYRRIRLTDGDKKRPRFTYFERWDGDEPNGFAWWTPRRTRARRFDDAGEARTHVAKLRDHLPIDVRSRSKLRIVRVMGQR